MAAWLKKWRDYIRGQSGATAAIFALALVPMLLAGGAGVDFTRALIVRSKMSEALDAAALAVGSTSGLSTEQMQEMAQNFFDANYTLSDSYGTRPTLTVTPSDQQLVITASNTVPTYFIRLAGYDSLPVSNSTTVVWGQIKLWVALVLDNTGSMGSGGRMTALKTASQQLLALLQGAASQAGDVKVSIVPFNTAVKIGTAYKNEEWLSYTAWDEEGAGYGYYQYGGGWWGWWGGGGGGSYTWYGYDSSHTSWTGCVMDRNQDYDVTNTLPATDTPDTLYQAAPPSLYSHSSWQINCPQQMVGLTDVLDGGGWSTLNSTITSMVSKGATNQTIGLQMGWMALTPGAPPFDPGSLPDDTNRVIILLSDGDNTMNRWDGNGSSTNSRVDDRMSTACANVKAAGITLYTVLVIDGNEDLLRNCATDSSKFFKLTDASQMSAAFLAIGQQITNLRVAQ